MKNPHDIILRPVLTEASYDGIANKDYTFEVALKANKTEIKQAIETIFGVKVERVKKAYVKLTESSKPIEFFEGMAE